MIHFSHVCLDVCEHGWMSVSVCVCLCSLYSVQAASTAKRCEYLDTGPHPGLGDDAVCLLTQTKLWAI